MREKICKVMNDLMQNNCICNYVIVQHEKEIYIRNIYSLDAYMRAYEMSKNGNVECYITSLKGKKAVHPVFSVIDGVIKLSGRIIK